MLPTDGSVDVVARMDYRLTGPTWFHTVQDQVVPSVNGPADYSKTQRASFGLLNARLGVHGPHWSVDAYANNLTDKRWPEEIVPAPELGGSFVSPGSRREFGVETGVKF